MKRINRLAARAFIDGKHFAKGGTVVHIKRRKVMLTNNDRLLAYRPIDALSKAVALWGNVETDDDKARLHGLISEMHEDGHDTQLLEQGDQNL